MAPATTYLHIGEVLDLATHVGVVAGGTDDPRRALGTHPALSKEPIPA